MNKEKQKAEAINRLKIIGVMTEVIDAFEKGNVWKSEICGLLYEIEKDSNEGRALSRFIKEHPNHMPFHCILSPTDFGLVLTILYVSDRESEWDAEKNGLKLHGQAFAYADNLSDSMCSEFGYVGIKGVNGGVTRTY